MFLLSSAGEAPDVATQQSAGRGGVPLQKVAWGHCPGEEGGRKRALAIVGGRNGVTAPSENCSECARIRSAHGAMGSPNNLANRRSLGHEEQRSPCPDDRGFPLMSPWLAWGRHSSRVDMGWGEVEITNRRKVIFSSGTALMADRAGGVVFGF